MHSDHLAKLALATTDEDPLAALSACAQIRQQVQRVEAVMVRRSRNAGASWSQIAAALGVSKQAVHQKYGGRRLGRAQP